MADPSNLERLLERFVVAAESIAANLERLYSLESKRLEYEYPPKHEPSEPIITKLPTEEDRLREEQGETDETLEDWFNIHKSDGEGVDEGAETEQER